MKNRILFGTVMIALVVGLFLLEAWMQQEARARAANARLADPDAAPLIAAPLGLALLALVTVAFVEVTRFCAAVGVMLLRVSGLIGAAMLATLPFWWQWLATPLHPAAGADDLLLLLGLIVLLVFAEQMARCKTDDAIRQISATFLAVVYLGVGAALVLHMRLAFGLGTLILFLASVKFTDIGAYFIGSAFGKHKMIPWLSPGKSWEGLVGGILVAAGVGALVTWLLAMTGSKVWAPGLGILPAAGFGALVGLAGQFADLCESLLKRNAKCKDSGALVPNFGGVLDIVDSPLLAAPVAVIVLRLLAG
jgi:phosphatidate cytidylyltransferase